MDINKMLADLRLEREQIEEAIMTLERLARGRGRRRGRPPAWMSQIKRRGRPPGSKNRPKNEPKGCGESRRRLGNVGSRGKLANILIGLHPGYSYP